MLPRAAPQPQGAGLSWRRFWAPLLIPMVTTPVLLRFVPTLFLPVLVGDYLSVHFAVYGMITAAVLAAIGGTSLFSRPERPARLAVAALVLTAYGLIALVAPINAYVTSFFPGPERLAILAALLAGALPYFLADEWLTRGTGAARFGYPVTKLAFLVSLGVAVTLDFERLFFLILMVPMSPCSSSFMASLAPGPIGGLTTPSSPRAPTPSPSPGAGYTLWKTGPDW